ncbi:MAG TPA: hypothetical protein VGM83_12605 [Devosiaceae bacterium]|jgi:hypothetical protein
MSDPRLLPAGHAAAFLPETGTLRRLPRAPKRARAPEFFERFEGRALYYDCFWHADGQRILLVGPPPLNLKPMLDGGRFTALPSKTPLQASLHISESVMITELLGAPAGTEAVRLTLGGEAFDLAVEPNLSATLAGRRVVFTMSKDNDLAWITDWARYHAEMHGAEAVVFFDNGSTRYSSADIEAALLGAPGIAAAAVLNWPYIYGATDRAVLNNPFYTQFLQVSAMSVALRRYAAKAAGLLNCDIDELVAAPDGASIFALAAQSPHGLVVMRGQFVEAASDATPPRHKDFALRLKDSKARQSRPRKWVLDPTRDWVRSLDVHPYMHWVHGRPWFSKTQSPEVFYWHFRGISTNWKDRRTDTAHLRIEDVERDERLAAVMGRIAW